MFSCFKWLNFITPVHKYAAVTWQAPLHLPLTFPYWCWENVPASVCDRAGFNLRQLTPQTLTGPLCGSPILHTGWGFYLLTERGDAVPAQPRVLLGRHRV